MPNEPDSDEWRYLAARLRVSDRPDPLRMISNKNSTPEQTRIESEIDELLSASIPQHEVFNNLRSEALRRIYEGRAYDRDPVDDFAKLQKVALEIHSKRPLFANGSRDQTVTAQQVSELHVLLTDHAKWPNKSKQFPPVERLGHRIFPDHSASIRGEDAGKGAKITRIKDISDSIMPSSPHYNGLRQEVFDLIRKKGGEVKGWVDEDKKISAENRGGFVPNPYHYKSKEVIAKIDGLIGPYKKQFGRDIPFPKPIRPESAAKIGRLIVKYHETEEHAVEPAHKIRRLGSSTQRLNSPSQVSPQLIQRIVRSRDTAQTVPVRARQLARNVISEIHKIVPQKHANFDERIKFAQTIFSNRQTLIAPPAAVEEIPPELRTRQMKSNKESITRMARLMSDYVDNYKGRVLSGQVSANTPYAKAVSREPKGDNDMGLSEKRLVKAVSPLDRERKRERSPSR